MNDQRILFLNYLFDRDSEHRGDPIASGLAAGYARGYISELLSSMRDDIRSRTVDHLASMAPKAIMTVEDAMEDSGATPKGELRLKAAESVLDRMGASKQQAIDITSKDESISPLFFLPSKAEVDVDPDYDDIDLK